MVRKEKMSIEEQRDMKRLNILVGGTTAGEVDEGLLTKVRWVWR
jgi:hypothetical protein